LFRTCEFITTIAFNGYWFNKIGHVHRFDTEVEAHAPIREKNESMADAQILVRFNLEPLQ
jgi:hypothetical protein